MPTFLNSISVYNAKASAAITEAVREGQVERANMMSALKTAANDTSLSDETRLNALTALINLGQLLDIALPPYFPVTTTFADTQTYVGLHNDLTGIQGGAPGEYLHLTQAEKDSIAGKASLSQITFANLLGFPSDNTNLANALNAKQNSLNGNGFVKASGGTITYDPNTYLQNINTIAAGGDLSGFYPSPSVTNSAVINKALNGFNGSATWSAVTASDTVITAIQKLNAYAVAASAVTGAVNSVALTLPTTVFTSTTTPATGPVMLSGSFINQTANRVFAGPLSGGPGQPAFRALVAADLPTTGIGTGTAGTTNLIPVITYDNYGRITNITTQAASNGGVVDTVGFTVPAGAVFDRTIGGTTTDPVINFLVLNQDPNKVWAGPGSGTSTGGPTFRLLVPADIPVGIPQANIQDLLSSLNAKLGAGLNTSLIYMGNGSGVAAQSIVGGDLTAIFSEPSGINTATFTIANKAVTYAKFADVPDSPSNAIRPILLGRFSSGQGPMQQMTLDPLAFNYNSTSGEIGLLVPNPPSLVDAGDLLTSSGANILERLSLPVDYATKGYLLVPYAGTTAPDIKLMWGEAKGDITYSIDTTTTPGTPFPNFSIGANKVTLAKIQTIATNTILGNNTVSGSIPLELSTAQVVEMLPLQNATTGLTKGVVPASNFTPAAGKNKSNYYLSANNTWELSGGGTGGSPGGTGSEIQYRAGASTFGGVPSLQYDGTAYVNSLVSTFAIVDNVTTPTTSVIFDSFATTLGQTWNFPDATAGATFVGEDLVQTLTEKTLGLGTKIDIDTPVKGTIWYSNDTLGTLKGLSPTGNGGKFLRLDASTLEPVWDTVSGSGTVTSSGIKEIAYYDVAGDTVKGLPVSGTNGTFFLSQTITGAVPANPAWVGVTGTGVVVLADNPTILQAKFGNGAGNGHVHFRRGNTPGGLTDNATLAFLSATKTMSLEFELDGFQSQFLFAATASRVYTFPNLTGTVALTANPASFTTLTATTSTTLGVIGPGGTTGNLILLNQSSGFSTTIRAGVATGNATYTLPLDVPTANGYILSSTTGGVMSWVPLSGVADGTYGQVEVTVSGTIWTPINLDAGTVNNFATVQGPVILANTAGVVQQPSWSDPADVTQVLTVFQGTSAVATARGLVPAPTLITDIGKFLRADGTWQTVTGSGDMVLASAQRNTGIKTFAPGSLIIQQGGVGTPGTILASNATGSNKTATFQDATGIVPFLGLGQTWTAAQLFNSGFLQLRNAGNTQTTTIAGGTTAGSYTLTIPAITANDTFTVLGLAQTFAAKKTVQYVQATANTGTFSVVNQDTGTQTQLGIDVTLNGTGTNVSSRMGLWTVWNTSMVGSGTLGNNWNFMVARNTANNNTWLISNTGNVYPTAFSVGMPAGFYFGNQSLTDGVLRATANYWYRYFLDISPETGNTITAGSTELVVTGYTKFASRTGVFVIPGVTVTNPYIGHFTECFAPNNGNSATVTAPRIGTAQWAYTQGTNITIPHTGGLFGHFNEYNTQAGSNPTTFTSLNQLAIWHFNNTSSSSIGAVVTGLKIYRTVGGGNVQSKAAIYIDNQTSTASILNPRLNTNVTTGQTYTNPPWSIFAEADKAAFGGGILIKSSPALSDALTSTWLSIGAGTTAKSQINLATSTAPTTPVDGDIWFDGTNLKIRVSGATYTLTKTP